MDFRTATPADIDAMVQLVNAAYRGTGGVNGWTTEAHLVEGARAVHGELLAMMTDPAARFELGHGDDGSLVASTYLRREQDGTCYLGMLSVDPRLQGAGIGRAIMTHAEDVARAWSCVRMRITVLDARPELIAYYERRGYRPTGKGERFPESARSRLKTPDIMMLEFVKPLP